MLSWRAYVLALTLAGSLLECALPAPTYTVQELGDAGYFRGRFVRQDHSNVEPQDSEDDHDHDHDHSCDVVGDDVRQIFDELVKEVSNTSFNGEICSPDFHSKSFGLTSQMASNLTCKELYYFVSQMLLRLNVTDECCLVNGTACHDHDHDHGESREAYLAEVYGYGFLMILLVSSCSLLGVAVIPLLRKNSTFGQLYKYTYALMIAMGASALFCDAILHLIPEALGLHDHDHSEEEAHSEEGDDQAFIWKGCVVIAGTYFFFVFETILHTWNPHDHSHGTDAVLPKTDQPRKSAGDLSRRQSDHTSLRDSSPAKTYGSTVDAQDYTDKSHLVDSTFNDTTSQHSECDERCVEPTVPHGKCRDSRGGTPGIMHPGATVSIEDRPLPSEVLPSRMNCFARTWHYLLNVKPLAWLIIFGDAIHNFADGLALGAAISQSLSLGLSTMIALTFHEIPHELGDFVILLSTGMQWPIALLFNVLSQVTAIVAFFIGVAISTNSKEANGWILAIAAGVFLYISLVDLLPGLIHTKDKGCSRWGQFVMCNVGFLVAFIALLLLAMFEEELNAIIDL